MGGNTQTELNCIHNANRTLKNPQIYVSVEENDEFCGTSIFWKLENEIFWYPIDEIQGCSKIATTVVLDLPKFDKNPFCNVYGTISYEIDDNQYQTPLPVICLTIEDTINDKYQVNFSTRRNYDHTQIEDTASSTLFMILALKSTSVEKTVDAEFKGNLEKQKQFLCFLQGKSFQTIYTNIYMVQTTCSLMNCLIEILPSIEGKEKLRISSRSIQQMNIMLRLLRDQFPDMNIEEDVNPIRAAAALMEELKLYLENASTAERQIARIRTDLLIP